jgi:hypothetical protein
MYMLFTFKCNPEILQILKLIVTASKYAVSHADIPLYTLILFSSHLIIH